MDRILEIASRHNLAVIEDCAHALGAKYRGRAAGTFGDASFFSFQMLKPLNTYGGGLAAVRSSDVATRARSLADAEPWPSDERVLRKIKIGNVQRLFSRPGVFTFSTFPILWAASFKHAKPDVYLWEKIRPLDPLPGGYRERYANVQAAIGMAGLKHLDDWTKATQANARAATAALASVPGLVPPLVPAGCEHVYYQYCVSSPAR